MFSSMVITGAADIAVKDSKGLVLACCLGALNGLAVEPTIENGFDRAIALGADVQPPLAGRLDPACAERLGEAHDA